MNDSVEFVKFMLGDGVNELRWEGDELIAWIRFAFLEEFAYLLGDNVLSERGYDIVLLCDCIALDIVELCEWFEVDPEQILSKEEK